MATFQHFEQGNADVHPHCTLMYTSFQVAAISKGAAHRLAAVRFVLLLLILCGSDLSPTHASPIDLVVWGMESTAETKDQDAQIAAFERMYPNIRVATLSMGAGEMNPQKLMTAIVGGVPPDVIQQDRFTIGDWASRGAFQSLDRYLAVDEKSRSPLAVHKRNFLTAAWSEAVYQGHVYAIPNYVDDRVLFFNRQLFRKAGLDPDNPPQTWDQLISDAKKLTVKFPDGEISRLGFDPAYLQGWLYTWSWQEDGEFMSLDGRRCTIDNSQTQMALTALVSWYDQLGGVDPINEFAGSFSNEQGANDPFLNGQLAMKTDGDFFINYIARYAPNLDFGVCPIPVPSARFDHQGRFRGEPTWVTWSGGHSLVIPRGAAHPKEAWEFIEWMTSPQAALIGVQAQTEYQRSLGRLYVPVFSANKLANESVFRKYVQKLPPRLSTAKAVALSLLPLAKCRPVTFVGQDLWNQMVIATDAATRHNLTPASALQAAESRVQYELDANFNARDHPLLPAEKITIAFAALAAALFIVLGFAYYKSVSLLSSSARSEASAGLLFITPWVFGFVLLTLGPILVSLVLSFCDYDVLHPARWVGGANYAALFTTDRQVALKSLANAVYLAVFGIPLNMATGLSMAMLLNNKVRGLKWYRTAFYIPSIVPAVAGAVLWGWILNPNPHLGLIDALWFETFDKWFHIAPPGWETVPQWSKLGVILMGLWGAGGSMILWLAGLQGIPKTLYEAASLDGVSPWAKFWHITLPMLSPYVLFNLIMGVIGALQTFDSSYILGGTDLGGSTGPDDSLLVPVVYLFNNGFRFFRMGYASAIAWVLFVFILALTAGQLKFSTRWVHYDGGGR